MKYITAVNDYVLLMPSGELRGYKDIDSAMFQDEKDEIISKLLREDINMNVYDYGLFSLLNDFEVEWA